MPAFIEVSHVIEAGMKTYPGLPEPVELVVMSYGESRTRYAADTEFYIASLHLCGNTGTYVDAPIHRFRGGTDLAELPLDRVAGLPLVVIDARNASQRRIGPDVLRGQDCRGRAVLFHTGWSRHWRTERYFDPNPCLTAECCVELIAAGAVFVGIDSLNIDDMQDGARPAHTLLLGAGIPICEHMTNLEAVPGSGGQLHAVPIAWRGGASFPVRAYVVVA
jgi:arylformamidase